MEKTQGTGSQITSFWKLMELNIHESSGDYTKQFLFSHLDTPSDSAQSNQNCPTSVSSDRSEFNVLIFPATA